MNQGIRNSIAVLGQVIPFRLLRAGKKYPSFLPFYHVVSDVELDYINSYRVRSKKHFEAELDYLLRYFKPVDLSEIITSPAKNKMHLSFDDGLKECYSIIAPILKRKGIPATFFVNPDFVDNKKIFHRFKRAVLESKGVLPPDGKKYFIREVDELDVLAKENGLDFSNSQPYMSLDEITALHNDGFAIGAHSLDHSEMWTLTEEEQYQQVVESMQWVVDRFSPAIKAFSFPFTDDGLKPSLFDSIKASGKVDITFGTAGLKYDSHPINLQRVPMELKQNWSAQKVVHFEYFYSFLRSVILRNQVIHKFNSI